MMIHRVTRRLVTETTVNTSDFRVPGPAGVASPKAASTPTDRVGQARRVLRLAESAGLIDIVVAEVDGHTMTTAAMSPD